MTAVSKARRTGKPGARLLPALFVLIAACTGAPAATIDEVAWIAGCWALDGAEPGSGEQWTSAAGGTMLGTNRAVRGGRTEAYEFLQIRETEEGSLTYIAAPQGQTETRFTLISIGPTLVAFENSANEFPQRIIYSLVGEDALTARIEGKLNGEQRAVDFPMRRVSCG
jgi:hypothetical protein